jgi:RNA polymerase sigma factor (sigma-70 family)
MPMTQQANELFEKKYDLFVNLATNAGREDNAYDVVQQTWIDLERWADFKEGSSDKEIISYMAKAVERNAITAAKKESSRLDSEGYYTYSERDDYDGFEQNEYNDRLIGMGDNSMVNSIDTKLDIETALTTGVISNREYDVFYAIVVDRMTQREAGDVLGITQGRVSQILKDAQHKLVEFFDGEVPSNV